MILLKKHVSFLFPFPFRGLSKSIYKVKLIDIHCMEAIELFEITAVEDKVIRMVILDDAQKWSNHFKAFWDQHNALYPYEVSHFYVLFSSPHPFYSYKIFPLPSLLSPSHCMIHPTFLLISNKVQDKIQPAAGTNCRKKKRI